MKEKAQDKKLILEQVAQRYDPSSPGNTFDYWFVRLGFEAIKNFLKGDQVLEMGCATGLMTSLLVDVVRNLTVVEGSLQNIRKAQLRVGEREIKVQWFHSLWEDFEPPNTFSDIILAGALEHVENPILILRRARSWLKPEGRIHIIVPNAKSLHRRVGVYMGILQSIYDFSESDKLLEHQRIYDKELLFKHLHESGFTVLHWQGILLKPLSNAQMQGWSELLIRALYQVGLELPDYCGEIYVCAIPTESLR